VVAFESYATDFGPTDTRADCVIIVIPGQGPVYGPCTDVYARDLTTGTTSMISVNAAGTNGGSGSPSRHPVFSPDGTRVTFESSADDLVSPTVNFPYAELLVRDLRTGTTSLVSAGPTGAPGNGESGDATFSPDGTKVLFSSSSSNLGPTHSIDPGNVGLVDLYVRDLATGGISQVTINAAGTDGGLGSSGSFSPDGTKVVFASNGSTLVANDTNGHGDVFLRDLSAGTTTLLSPNAAGTGSAGDSSFAPLFNGDGTEVVFTSWADDLGPKDTVTCAVPFPGPGTRSCADVYVRDVPRRTTALVSADAAHADASNGDAALPVFTPDGKVVYTSLASNLGPTDTNGGWDIYIASVTPPPSP
jgi:Tol biopolymer transport system component